MTLHTCSDLPPTSSCPVTPAGKHQKLRMHSYTTVGSFQVLFFAHAPRSRPQSEEADLLPETSTSQEKLDSRQSRSVHSAA